MKQRAAIYIRVSSEKQAEGASPEAQEADCRALCARLNYQVEEVYRDTEKYRVHGRMVEPSGTRSDRPQFNRMLHDADEGKFDVLVCWREDRLYRGVTRAVIDLKERVKSGAIRIDIVNGGFNLQTMEVLAWAAGVENEARVERRAMGMARRLSSGKVNLPNPVYGYTYEIATGSLIVNETEASWVQQIWKWYAEGVPRYELRRRLIAADAPQSKTGASTRKHKWSLGLIDDILRRSSYHTGIFATKLGDQTYEASIPILIDAETHQAVQNRHSSWKAYPAGNMKEHALVAGMIYCVACGTRMGMSSRTSSWAPGKKYLYY